MKPGEINDEQIECLICHKRLKHIPSHLVAHKMTTEEYRDMFPGAIFTAKASRAKRSVSMKKCVHTPEWNAKISKTMIGRPFPEELKQEVSETMTKYCAEHPDFRKKKPGQVEKHKASLALYNESPAGVAQRQKHSKHMTVVGKQRYIDHPEEFLTFIEAGQEHVQWKDTKPELNLAAILTELGLEHVAQGRIEELNKPYRYHRWDFTIPSLKIALEADGGYWHACPEHYPERQQEVQEQSEKELARDLEADLTGWLVLRFWECLLDERMDEVRECIANAAVHQMRMVG